MQRRMLWGLRTYKHMGGGMGAGWTSDGHIEGRSSDSEGGVAGVRPDCSISIALLGGGCVRDNLW